MANKIRHYTKEDINFIRENIDIMSYKEMAKYFSQKYNMSFREDSISKVAIRNGIKKQTRLYNDRKNSRFKNEYTLEMLEFLKCNFDCRLGWQGLTDLFNSVFKTNLTKHEISGICSRKYGFVMDNITVFRKETHPYRLDIGTERIGSGYKVCVKVSDNNLPSGNSSNWKQKSRVVYEQAYGEIPDDCLILHLDGDSNNFDTQNLYCVDKKVLACLTRERWHLKEKELALAAIKCAELMCDLKESEVV